MPFATSMIEPGFAVFIAARSSSNDATVTRSEPKLTGERAKSIHENTKRLKNRKLLLLGSIAVANEVQLAHLPDSLSAFCAQEAIQKTARDTESGEARTQFLSGFLASDKERLVLQAIKESLSLITASLEHQAEYDHR
ncbi:MAG: hypothetical protein RH917_02800 [Lacipirellulaceae bacterium]